MKVEQLADQLKSKEALADDVDARFLKIIEQIEKLPLAPEELEDIELTPVAKPPGTDDQGYRHD